MTMSGLESAAQLRKTVITGQGDRIVREEDVAEVIDGSEGQSNYVSIGFGPAFKGGKTDRGKIYPAVTLTFSKKEGLNSVTVAQKIIEAAKKLKQTVLPDDVQMI